VTRYTGRVLGIWLCGVRFGVQGLGSGVRGLGFGVWSLERGV
jgi:hypothetical protein